MKFFQSGEFKELSKQWDAKLSDSGFKDIENHNGTLKAKNIRTQAYIQQSDIQRISSALGFYIENANKRLKDLERKILDLHAQGIYRKEIMRLTRQSHTTVWRILKAHIPLALALYSQEEMLHEEDLEDM